MNSNIFDMNIHASLQTDIPAYYLKWFLKRMQEGYIDSLNPSQKNPPEIIRHYIGKEDNVFFYTRNPSSFCKSLKKVISTVPKFELTTCIDMYEKYYHPNAKPLNKIIEQIDKIGESARLRNGFCYGPIFRNNQVDISWHIVQFKYLCSILQDSITHAYISFSHGPGQELIPAHTLEPEEKHYIYTQCMKIANDFGFRFNILPDVDDLPDTDLDIGMPKVCLGGCVYCKYSPRRTAARALYSIHDENSSMLIDKPPFQAVIKIAERKE